MESSPSPIVMSRNHPPMVSQVFDREYLSAQDRVLSETPPSAIIGAHRWMGTERDRIGGARFTGRRLGQEPDPGRVVVTNGTQSGLLMLFAGLVGRGGVLVTEDLTYPPLHTFARHFGFRIVGAPIDEQGLIPDGLREIAEREKPQALYTVATFQNPTTAIMSLERRRDIANIARTFNMSIIEDDIYSLMLPDAPPPLSALAPERSWYVLGTAKSIAAGMKVAYVVAPTPEAAEQRFWPGVRGTHWMSAPIGAAVMTAMIETSGDVRIIDAVADEVRGRQSLARDMFSDIAFTSKPEALHVWFPLPEGMARTELAARARENGLVIGTSDEFATEGTPIPEAVRMGIGNPKTREVLTDALSRFVAAYEEARP